MERLAGQQQLALVLRGQPIFRQRQITVFIGAVKFVADNRMPAISEVDSNLMFSSRDRRDAQERELACLPREPAFDPEFRLRGYAIGPRRLRRKRS